MKPQVDLFVFPFDNARHAETGGAQTEFEGIDHRLLADDFGEDDVVLVEENVAALASIAAQERQLAPTVDPAAAARGHCKHVVGNQGSKRMCGIR